MGALSFTSVKVIMITADVVKLGSPSSDTCTSTNSTLCTLTLSPPAPNIFGFSFFISKIKNHIFNMLKIKCDINQ